VPRRAATRQFNTRQRQPTTWARQLATDYVVVPAASKALLAGVALSNPGIGETIRRTRGRFSISSDQNAAVEDQIGALGFVVVSDIAFAAGAASIPGPGTEASDDGWFVWESAGIRSQLVAVSVGALTTVQYEFDSKAMRKIQEGFTVAIMFENVHPTDGLAVWCGFSLLSSLS